MTSPAGGRVLAWLTDDGRVISAVQKSSAIADGGASKSSVAPYNIPLTLEALLTAAESERDALRAEVVRLTQLVSGGKGGLPERAVAWLDMGKGEASITFSKKHDSNRASKRNSMELFNRVPAGYYPLYLSPQNDELAAGVRALADELIAHHSQGEDVWPDAFDDAVVRTAHLFRALLAGDGEHNTGEMK